MKFRIRSNAGDVAKRLRRRAANAQKATDAAIAKEGPEIVKAARAGTKKDTGASAAGWRAVPIKGGLRLQNTRPRARFVLGGALIPLGREVALRHVRSRKREIAKNIKEG